MFPRIFNVIDHAMKESITIETLQLLDVDAAKILRPGRIRSAPFEFEEGIAVIYGEPDCPVLLRSGKVMVLDYKTTAASDKDIYRYTNQLSAYALMMEVPDRNAPVEIDSLGLIVNTPHTGKVNGRRFALMGDLSVKHIRYQREAFMRHLHRLVQRQASPKVPEASERCAACGREAEIQHLTGRAS